MLHTDSTQINPKKYRKIFSYYLIFVYILGLCSHYVAYASDPPPSLAENVFEKYRTFFQREDIKELLPTVLAVIKKPDSQNIINPTTIDLIVRNPDLLKEYIPEIDDKFITLLKEDQEIQDFLRDTDVQTLLQNIAAIEELETLLLENLLSLAEKIHERYLDFFMREDVQKQLPTLLLELKNPDIQKLLNPTTIQLVVDNPDILKTFLPDIDDELIRLLKEDTEIITFISDPDVQKLLQDPMAIDELAMLLDIPVPVTVKIVPASIESPRVGEQLIITVDIADGIDVAGYQGTLNFDPSALKFISLEHGTYFQSNVFPIDTDIKDASVTFAQIIAATGVTASTTEGTLVTVTFEVVDAKASMLSLTEVIISGLGGVEFPVIIENAEILEPATPPWDVNDDGRVNILDLTFVASHFGADNPPPEADVNGDGRVNILDLTLVASHFGETT